MILTARTWILSIAVVAVVFPAVARPDDTLFEKEIRPLFIEKCGECHGEKDVKGGLRLTSRETLLKGGDSGPAVVPGKPDESLLIHAVEYLDEPKMPPKEKLSATDVARLREWVAAGAVWPASNTTAGQRVTKESSDPRSWWAFQPVTDRSPPEVQNRAWPRTAIDRFVLAELESRGMTPAPPAERRTWLRRVTFDLTGMPPTAEEASAFVVDDSPVAIEKVVDRLLASPAYGQRWARHWLDVVRYADYHDGDPKPRDLNCEPMQAWRYRDWVVDAFNRDLPFDQFIVHQIAGDLQPNPDGRDIYPDGLVATTFLTNGAWDRGDADKEKMVSDMVDDQIDTIGKAFLGLTLGCARCHDHKFDPVSQHDYYALAGIFYSTRILKELGTKGGNYTLQRVPLAEKAYVAKREEQVRLLAEANGKLAELDKRDPRPAGDDPERKALTRRRDEVQRQLLPEPEVAEAASDGGTPGGLFPGIQDVPVHIRGSYTRLGPVIPRRMPAFFAGESQPAIGQGSGRRELAAWVASKDNPLTARVIVNRIWQAHFGAGLVRTPNNFGRLSEPPSHPELLDWLAARFVEDGWSLKALHRRIVLSATYAQTTLVTPEQANRDPENRWLARFAVRRLEAEAIRDALLSVTGRLDPIPGGPATDALATSRRSLYVQTARWDRGSFAILFDAANPDASDEKRNVSTVAPQALFLMNNPFVLDRARELAERLLRDVPASSPNADATRLDRAYQLLFNRPPQAEEVAIAKELLANGDWADLAHVLLCSNEFVYVD